MPLRSIPLLTLSLALPHPSSTVSPSLSYLLSLPLAAIGAVSPFSFSPARLLGDAAGVGAGMGPRQSALARAQAMLGPRAREVRLV